ncbi:MAG: carbonic anhydrase [Comamonadaceae bacterium]|nr:MAG: carbonic anhydrase [Comamonadaceae bacterium]
MSANVTKTTLGADAILALLRQGNANFVSEGALRQPIGLSRVLALARGQAPMAVLVGCSDSRVPPEHLFGRGLGELFIVRNAGNTIDNVAQGSIEYAVIELGVPLIVVLGHERCGAVDAALSVVESNAAFPGSIGKMIEPIIPAVLKARSDAPAGPPPGRDALLEASVRENVRRVVHQLRTSDALLLDRVRSGKLMVVGARYDLDDGRVEFMAPA